MKKNDLDGTSVMPLLWYLAIKLGLKHIHFTNPIEKAATHTTIYTTLLNGVNK